MDTRVRLHAELPTFQLPDLHGHEISLWDYKQQQPVVLVFCGADCDALLHSFAERYADYRSAGAEVLVITPKRLPAATQWPFPVLVDAGDDTISRYVEHTPAVLLVDSYNTLHERVDSPGQNGIDHRRLLSKISELELRCPECGAPAWPES